MDSEGMGPKPPERNKVLKFERPEEPIQAPERPLIGAPVEQVSTPEGPIDLGDEKYRQAHRRLRDKFRFEEAARAGFAAVTAGNGGSVNAADIDRDFRAYSIDVHAREFDNDKESAAKFIDTQLLSQRAQADLDEETYVKLRTAPKEETERVLEEAYARAKEKYGALYPAAASRIFHWNELGNDDSELPKYRASQPQSQSQPGAIARLWNKLRGK
jgi:hypothetical protein